MGNTAGEIQIVWADRKTGRLNLCRTERYLSNSFTLASMLSMNRSMYKNRYFVEKHFDMSTIQALKLELMEWLATVHDQALIKELAKWKEEHQHISLEQYNKELDEADAAIDRGEFFTQEEVERRSKSW